MPDFPAKGSQRAFPGHAHPQDECHDKHFQDECTIQCDTGYTQSIDQTTGRPIDRANNQAEFACAAGHDTDATSTRSARSVWQGPDLSCESAIFPCVSFSSSRSETDSQMCSIDPLLLWSCFLQRSTAVHLQQEIGPRNDNRCMQSRSRRQHARRNSGTCVQPAVLRGFTSTQTIQSIVGRRCSTPAEHLPPTLEALAHGRGQNQTRHQPAVQ